MKKPAKRAKKTSRARPKKSGNPAIVRERAAADYEAAGRRESLRGRRPVNLTLAHDAMERGEQFAARHGVSVSTLVSGFLLSLPDDDADVPSHLPAVQRLYGLLAGHEVSREHYRAYLASKYGVR